MTQHQQTDIVIIGAGVVGLASALAIAPTGLRVLVLDAQLGPSEPPTDRSLDDWARRVTALTPASSDFLSRLGAWDEVLSGNRVGAYTDMVVWDSEGTGKIAFNASELSIPTLGYIAESTVTLNALIQQVSHTPNITMLWDTRLDSLVLGEDGAHLVTSAGADIVSRLAIGADGGQSVSRALAGIRTRQWSYRQKAIVATVRVEPDHASTCWQAFLPTGPLALLPLADTTICSLVWSLDDARCEPWLAAGDEAFIEGLNSAFGGRGPTVTGVSERQVFPLHQCHAVDYARDGFVLIGDAAHAIHPLAGQGINLGLSDANVLGEEIVRAHARGAAWWGPQVLKRYERRRKGENLAMMSAMQAFKWGFGSQNPATTVLRNLGLTAVDRLPTLKRWFITQAVGID